MSDQTQWFVGVYSLFCIFHIRKTLQSTFFNLWQFFFYSENVFQWEIRSSSRRFAQVIQNDKKVFYCRVTKSNRFIPIQSMHAENFNSVRFCSWKQADSKPFLVLYSIESFPFFPLENKLNPFSDSGHTDSAKCKCYSYCE